MFRANNCPKHVELIETVNKTVIVASSWLSMSFGSTILKEWTTPDSRNTPSTTNLEEEEIVDAPGNDGNASTPEQVNRPNPWRKMMMMINPNYRTHFITQNFVL